MTRTSEERSAVCVLGHHALDYPRNAALQGLIRDAGFEIELCHSTAPFPFRTWILIAKYLRVARRVSAVIVTEGGHRHVAWLKPFTWLTRRRLVFDPFLSRYNTRVEDRKLYAARSVNALGAYFQDWASCHAADALIFDTHEHQRYFFEKYALDKPWTVIEVGVDEALFAPARWVEPGASHVEVLFYGTYIPLQGIEHIVHAADRLRDQAHIRFKLIGDGQERPRIEALVRQLALPNIELLPLLPVSELPARIAAADICLGIFDAGSKASNVVPNKVVQCAAVGKPIITRGSPAIERYFAEGESVALVPPADPDALAQRIAALAADPALRRRLGSGARRVFEQRFSAAALLPPMKALLTSAAAATR
jgi:glycosyltransferase involved in cell wall biosynthesis